MSLTDTLKWANSLESEDGVAQYTDAKEAKSSIDMDDVDPKDIIDVDTETKTNTDGGDEVGVSTTHDIVGSIEDHEASIASGDAGGKTIESFGVDPKSNAPKRFVISGFNAQTNPAAEAGDNLNACVLLMQNGVIPEVGLNGVTAEDLLKVVEEIYVCFQEGQFACQENEEVLQHVRAALGALAKRLNRRKDEGTEGTYEGN
jgi:hypothetical protein